MSRRGLTCKSLVVRRTLTVLVLLVQLTAGCATSGTYDQQAALYSEPATDFHNGSRLFAVAPVAAPRGFEVAESSLVQIDSLVEDALVDGGHHCVPAAEYSRIWERAVRQMGGLYDSTTGDLDEFKVELARDRLRLDLIDMYHADYVVFPEIWIVQAETSGGIARWDGASQPVVGLGVRVMNAIDALLHQYEGFLEPGLVDALSLGVVVEDMEGTVVYQNAGGIEVLEEGDAATENEDNGPFSKILTDGQRNQRAVRSALLPLLEGGDELAPSAYSRIPFRLEPTK